MVVIAWIIGITVFILSLISLWGMGLSLFLIICGLLALGIYTEFDPFDYLEEDVLNMLWFALIGPWMLVLLLTTIGRVFGFFEDVGKAVKNLADDDRRRY